MTDEEKIDLAKKGYTPDQIVEIEEGKNVGVDVSIYARKQYLAIQMCQIKLGLFEKLPVEIYAKPEFDWFQMEEIRKGLSKKLNVEIYAKPTIPYNKMREMRKGLEKNFILTEFLNLDAGKIRQIRKAKENNVDIMEYIDDYSAEQLEQIRDALQEGLPIKEYLSANYRGASINEIKQGLKNGLDVSVYAQESYNWEQMREIRLGMEHRVDYKMYLNPWYSSGQMREIRLGLENGINARKYASFMYTAMEMEMYRIRLQERIVGNMTTRLSVSEYNFDDESTDALSDDFILNVHEDGMEVYLSLTGENTVKDFDNVIEALHDRNVTYGIDEEVIRNLLAGKNAGGRTALVAKGDRPEDGKDGYYEFFFKTDLNKKPKLLEDGSVDYKEIDWYEMVEKGQKIVLYHPAEDGKDGMTVTGYTLPASRGKEQPIITGKGFTLSEDKMTYYADFNGIILYENNMIVIKKVLELDEVSPATGDIEFNGLIHVKGNIFKGMKLTSSGDIIVDGFVENAEISSDGDIVLKEGMNGSGGVGIVKAKGNVYGKFFEAVELTCGGDFSANYCLNSVVSTGGKATLNGSNGNLVGGSMTASAGLIVHDIGNGANIETNVVLGNTDYIWNASRDLEMKQKEIEHELTMLKNAQKDMMRKFQAEERSAMDVYKKFDASIYAKNKELEEIVNEIKECEETARLNADVSAEVNGTIYEGAVVEINGAYWKATRSSRVNIKNAGGRIAVYTL